MATFVCNNCKARKDVALKVTINQKNYCAQCAPQFAQESKNYQRITDIVKEKWEGEDDEPNYGIIGNLVRTIRNKYELDNSQIYYILEYMYHYRDEPAPPLRDEMDLFNVIRYYSEAKKFWRDYRKTRNVSDMELKNVFEATANVVTIKRSNIDVQHELALARKNTEGAKRYDIKDLMREYEGEDLDNYTYDYSDEFKSVDSYCGLDDLDSQENYEKRNKNDCLISLSDINESEYAGSDLSEFMEKEFDEKELDEKEFDEQFGGKKVAEEIGKLEDLTPEEYAEAEDGLDGC